MYVCILDQTGQTLLHQNLKTSPELLLRALAPYREDVCVAAECLFVWYWLADLCAQEGIPFILGHALYMRAVHGGKTKNDKIDSAKIATLLRGGTLPMAYVYPQQMRATRDLLRRRMYLVNKRAELLTHIQNTNSQYNLPAFSRKIAYKANRDGIAELFPDPSVRKSIQLDLDLLAAYDQMLTRVELDLVQTAKHHDAHAFHLLRSVPGIGKILALVLLYEIHDINRFPTVQDFVSYCRLVKPRRESSGKSSAPKNSKIGNAHLKWAFSEAACLFLRYNPGAQSYHSRLVGKYGKAKALSILAHKLGRAVYFILKRRQPFNAQIFFNNPATPKPGCNLPVQTASPLPQTQNAVAALARSQPPAKRLLKEGVTLRLQPSGGTLPAPLQLESHRRPMGPPDSDACPSTRKSPRSRNPVQSPDACRTKRAVSRGQRHRSAGTPAPGRHRAGSAHEKP
jgi:transposase